MFICCATGSWAHFWLHCWEATSRYKNPPYRQYVRSPRGSMDGSQPVNGVSPPTGTLSLRRVERHVVWGSTFHLTSHTLSRWIKITGRVSVRLCGKVHVRAMSRAEGSPLPLSALPSAVGVWRGQSPDPSLLPFPSSGFYGLVLSALLVLSASQGPAPAETELNRQRGADRSPPPALGGVADRKVLFWCLF